MNTRITPNHITELKPNEIFVFGSNLQGYHGGGAARLAMNQWGPSGGKVQVFKDRRMPSLPCKVASERFAPT